MTKHQFTNQGVAQLQASILALSPAELATQTSLIRTQFEDWLQDNFYFTQSQISQLQQLPMAFKQAIAIQLAEAWNNRVMISFFKEEDEKSPRDRDKDILLKPANQTVYSFDTGRMIFTRELSIWIT